MIVSSLLCERMGPLEAIHIIGAQRYNDYVGYGRYYPIFSNTHVPGGSYAKLWQWMPNTSNVLPGQLNIESKTSTENSTRFAFVIIKLLLFEAYAGFTTRTEVSRPIATGNWGCGVFGGDKELKSATLKWTRYADYGSEPRDEFQWVDFSCAILDFI
ncbi:unnamed protein product [Cylicostephanus goldi]|uniref:PARG catalytic Macro domain-containing protein n=1 Tax=Cylicostephanus goldi TaxID=71465 RepID=A0A3P7MAA0_CYLGO|nr:unnamed protein product [Cylicostephanus goldi]